MYEFACISVTGILRFYKNLNELVWAGKVEENGLQNKFANYSCSSYILLLKYDQQTFTQVQNERILCALNHFSFSRWLNATANYTDSTDNVSQHPDCDLVKHESKLCPLEPLSLIGPLWFMFSHSPREAEYGSVLIHKFTTVSIVHILLLMCLLLHQTIKIIDRNEL